MIPAYQLNWSPGERGTLGRARIDTPSNPSSNATQIIQLGRGPTRVIQANMVRKTGTEATRRAAVPEGTYCSAKVTPPLPTSSRQPPTIKPSRHSIREGSFAPRTQANKNITPPAARQRVPSLKNGGIDAIASRIPR